MTRSKKWIAGLFFLLLALVLAGTGLFLSRIVQSRETLQNSVIAQIEEMLDARVELEQTRFIFTPFPRLQAMKLQLALPHKDWPEWMARDARFSFSFLPLLWGKVQISGIQIRGGEGSFMGIPLEKIELKIRSVGPHKNSSFEWKAKVEGNKGSLKGKGKILFPGSKENFWRDLAIQSEAFLAGFSFPEKTDGRILDRLPVAFRSAEWQGEIHFAKDKSANTLGGSVKFQAASPASQTSGVLPFSLEGPWVLNFEKGSLELKHWNIVTPFSEIDGMAVVRPETGEITEARLHGRKVILEKLIQNVPAFQSLVPVDTGLSGESEFDLSLQGTWDYLSLHANWNLTPAVVTYGKIFSKPKDFPMRVNFDFLLKKTSLLSGDFSLRLKQVMIKGALVKLDLKTGDGEITLLTNKFDLGAWKDLLSSYAGYRVTGSAKWLLSCKGNLLQLGTAETMANVTLDDVTILSPSGRGIRKAQAHIDLSPLSLHVDSARFGLGSTSLQMETEIFNLGKNPQGKLELSSPRLDLFEVLENLKEFRPLRKKFGRWDALEKSLSRFFPRPSVFENLSLHLKTEDHKTVLQNLEFEAWGGKWGFEGEWGGGGEKPDFWATLRLQNVNLARYFEGRGDQNKILEGNLFFSGKFEGKGNQLSELWPPASGQGSLSITNGEWPSLDLAAPLKILTPLHALALPHSRSLPFNDLKADWKFKEGKFDTEDLILNTEDYWIEGKGNLLLKGVLNSRLEIYLSPALTDQVLKSWQAPEAAEGRQLGPIPLLLVGNVARPEPRIDTQLAESFLESIRSRKFRRILRKPFLESGKN